MLHGAGVVEMTKDEREWKGCWDGLCNRRAEQLKTVRLNVLSCTEKMLFSALVKVFPCN